MNLNSTPASSTASSSSVDTDEEIDQRVSTFLGVIEKAATLLVEHNLLKTALIEHIWRNRLPNNNNVDYIFFTFVIFFVFCNFIFLTNVMNYYFYLLKVIKCK